MRIRFKAGSAGEQCKQQDIAKTVAVVLAICFANRSAAGQVLRPIPKLATGEKVVGAEHPEYFSKYVAFHSMLAVLAVRPEDAVSLQRRARSIESRLIGLGDQDAAALETIVEEFRLKEMAMDVQVRLARLRGNASHQEFVAMAQQRHHEIASAAREVKSRLSPDGNRAVATYLSRTISKSVMQASRTTTSASKGATK